MCPPSRKYIHFTAIFLATGLYFVSPAFGEQKGLTAQEIVKRSVAVNASDWKAQPGFNHREQDIKSKIDSNGHVSGQQEKAVEVMMIDGSPYEQLIEINHEPLTSAHRAQEQNKLKHEIAARHHESPSQRSQRLGKYQRERSEEKLLMDQMVDAFHFSLAGEQEIDGVPCYVLDAKPDPNYHPPVQRARVLLGMKGRLYIDKVGFHWVRVQAQVISPVEFALFLAKVKPGTSFELEQAPVDNVWLPKHFVQSVNASVMGVYGVRNKDEELYSDYHPVSRASSDAHLMATAR